MIDIRDALYIPGAGFSTTKTKDQSLGSAEADFEALMKEVQAAREKQNAAGGDKGTFTRRPLTKADIKELAANYDPVNMTQEEYDSFLDDLIEKGVLEKEDLNYIDYRGDLIPNGQLVCVGKWDLLEDGPLQNYAGGGSLTWTGGSGSAPSISYRPSGPNVLAWAKEMSLWKPNAVGSTDSWLDTAGRRNNLLNVLADTLDAMRRQRVKDGL